MTISLRTALLVGLLIGASIGAVVLGVLGRRHDEAPLAAAHEVTAMATTAAKKEDAAFRADTTRRRPLVEKAHTDRAIALAHLGDSIVVTQAFRSDSVALVEDDSTISQAARTLQAHVVMESALRTELAISEKLRAPRFQVSSYAGVDVGGIVPVTGIEAEAHVSREWSLIGRVEKRWAAGEPTRRLLLVRRTF